MTFNLALQFQRSAHRFPKHTAIAIGSTLYSYGDIAAVVQRCAETLFPHLAEARVGILGSRSVHACAGILATAWAGGTYVPLSLKYPDDRLVELLEFLALDALIVDDAGFKRLTPELRRVCPQTILAPSGDT